MDDLSLEPDQSNTKDILLFTDRFTMFAIAICMINQKAQTVAKCLWENLMVCYGIPEQLHTDQGPDFESKLIKECCQLTGIVNSWITNKQAESWMEGLCKTFSARLQLHKE